MTHHHQGSALISALFIMTLVAIIATAMSTRLQSDIYQTRLTLNHDKLYLASEAVTFWAVTQLKSNEEPWVTNKRAEKHLVYPQTLQHLYPGVLLQGELSDLQAKFNINNISEKASQNLFRHLLQNVLPIIDDQEQQRIIMQIHANINENNSKNNQQTPTIKRAHQLMQHVSELRFLKAIDADRYQALFPYITALPEITTINLNTASKEILGILGDGLTDSQVNEILSARGKKGIQQLEALTPLLERLNIKKEQVALDSNYFLSVARASIDGQQLSVYTILKRQTDSKNNTSVRILSQRFNTP